MCDENHEEKPENKDDQNHASKLNRNNLSNGGKVKCVLRVNQELSFIKQARVSENQKVGHDIKKKWMG